MKPNVLFVIMLILLALGLILMNVKGAEAMVSLATLSNASLISTCFWFSIVAVLLILLGVAVALWVLGSNTREEERLYGARIEDLPKPGTYQPKVPHTLVPTDRLPERWNKFNACSTCHGVNHSLASDCPGYQPGTDALLGIAYGLLDFQDGHWTVRSYRPGEEVMDAHDELKFFQIADELNRRPSTSTDTLH